MHFCRHSCTQQHEATCEPATGHRLHFALAATVGTVDAGRNDANGARGTLRYDVHHKHVGQLS